MWWPLEQGLGLPCPHQPGASSDPGTGALGLRDVYHRPQHSPAPPRPVPPGPCPAPTHSLPQAPAGGLAPCPTAAAAWPILGHRQGFILRFLSILNSFIKLEWLLWDVNNYILKSHKPLKWLMLEGIPAASPRLPEGGVRQLEPLKDWLQLGPVKARPLFMTSVSNK